MALMKAIQVPAPGANFQLVEKEIPEPKDNEVRIKVQACGICHGDAIVKEGGRPGLVYPRVPGHEIVGTIDKLGRNVSVWKAGQRVGVGWYGGPCLHCEACLKGDMANCKNPLTTALSSDGGYAEYMVTAQQALTLIPEELNSLEAAPILCAGRTVFSALRHSVARAGDVVAVQGIGGLGHLGVQFARKMGFYTVALSRGKEKEELSKKLGAHLYIDATEADPAKELQKLGGARVILATAPDGKTITSVINGLANEGQLIIVSGLGAAVQFIPGQLMGGKRSIKGWVGGKPESKWDDAINFCVTTGALPVIEVFPLEKAAEAYEKMMNAKVHFRSVLKIGN